MRISFLHTVQSNQRLFEDTAKRLGVAEEDLRHELRPELREAVQRAGTMPEEVKAEASRRLLALAAEADAVILTCATLGAAADSIAHPPVPIVRADVALAVEANRIGGKIVVLCAVESTIEPNRQLFKQYASDRTTSIDVVLVEHAWTLFSSGNAGEARECYARIAAAANDAFDAGADVVAYAHPWMAAALDLADDDRRPLDSAHAALRTVLGAAAPR
ncbi:MULTISPECIES: arylsulfatase [Pandoraea]|uniref:arylsulfatase n=1 Tax=Pandoraea TaxID=93217 RepID=UPI001F5DBF84|nr:MULTISPECIES: arylsulfatase [Pandoraea]MCI3206522.1 arylsulfatase [Pandoraea sp. LA3]MDN4584550.1 arylsulfatase [Pandoraea capi]